MGRRGKRSRDRGEGVEYDWEDPDLPGLVGWDTDDEGAGSGAEDVDPRRWSQEQKAQACSDYVIVSKHRGTLTATEACILSDWIRLSKGEGLVQDIAMAPGNQQTGACSRHFDRVVGSAPTDELFF